MHLEPQYKLTVNFSRSGKRGPQMNILQYPHNIEMFLLLLNNWLKFG